jgi:hypothetical protein
LNVIDEGPLAVDLDDGKPFAVPLLEPRIAGDVDLVVLDALRIEDGAGTLAEVAPLRGVEDDARDRSRA